MITEGRVNELASQSVKRHLKERSSSQLENVKEV